jgi:hypothetical protein
VLALALAAALLAGSGATAAAGSCGTSTASLTNLRHISCSKARRIYERWYFDDTMPGLWGCTMTSERRGDCDDGQGGSGGGGRVIPYAQFRFRLTA